MATIRPGLLIAQQDHDCFVAQAGLHLLIQVVPLTHLDACPRTATLSADQLASIVLYDLLQCLQT